MSRFSNKTMIYALASAMLLTSLVAGCTPARALLIQRKAPFEKGISVRKNIRLECELETYLPETLEHNRPARYNQVVLTNDVPENTTDDILRMMIVGVDGGEEGTGGFAVAKSVTAAGTLTRNGQVIGSFTAFSYSGGLGIGECARIRSAVKKIGRDVSLWLRRPQMNSSIGEWKKKSRKEEKAAKKAAAEKAADDQE